MTESIALIYNKKLMPEPPETFDELIDFARKNTKPAEKNTASCMRAPTFTTAIS